MTVITIEDSLRSFLAEDLGYGDITTDAVINAKSQGKAEIRCKENAVIAGLAESVLLLKMVGCKATPRAKDGDKIPAGSIVLTVKGPARELLKTERTLLNLLSHMSGIATLTAQFVQTVKKAGGDKQKVRIAATRKTLPGLRQFEKKAVELGGGDTHRLRLDDAVLIKDNHLAFTRSLKNAIEIARERSSFTKKIEVEVTSTNEAIDAAQAKADIILFDNMGPQTIHETVNQLEKMNLRHIVMLEASGGINIENLADYARSGVDIISVGALTHSAKSVDMNMKIRPASPKNKWKY